MAGHTRRFSERLDDPDEDDASCLGVFSHSRTSLPSQHPSNFIRKIKRRKISGLNHRFDQMIESIGVIRSSPTSSGRSRAHSTGSSSIGSRDLLKTPADSYNGLDDGRLGKDFSLVKMKARSGSQGTRTIHTVNPDDLTNSPGSFADRRGPAPLPAWLCDTFSSLAPKHPLRVLLPPSPCDIVNRPASLPIDPLIETPMDEIGEPAPIFAFSPGRTPIAAPHEKSQNLRTATTQPLLSPLVLGNRVLGLDAEILESIPSDFQIPFSTPGPGSCAAYSGLGTTQSPLTYARFAGSRSTHLERQDIPELLSYTDLLPRPKGKRSSNSNSSSDPASFCYDATTDESTSDPVSEPAYIGPPPLNFFSTPGPGYCAPQMIHFDSPVEDPSSSDPLESGYAIDYGDIGFSWKPFNRKGNEAAQFSSEISAAHEDHNPLDSTAAEADCEGHFGKSIETGSGLLPANVDHDLAFTLLGIPEPPRLFRVPPAQWSSVDGTGPPPTPPQRTTSVFAPTPGILISPLKDPPKPEQPPQERCQEKLATQSSVLQALDSTLDYVIANPSSQISCDSIESWNNDNLNASC